MKLMVTDMGESNKHKVLVEYALRFIKDSVGEELSYFIETDINDGRPLPQLTMEGYRPDVFFEYKGIKQYRNTYPEMDSFFAKQVKTGEIVRAQDVRDILGKRKSSIREWKI